MAGLMSYSKAAGAYAARRAWKVMDLGEKQVHVEGVGNMILNPQDYIDSRLYFFGRWEPALSAFIETVAVPGSVAVDIGANIGYHTLLLSRVLGPEGRVYAVEPSPKILPRLRRNVVINGARNIEVVPVGISDRAERRDFVFDAKNAGASHFGQPSDSGLELVRLRSVIAPADLSRVSLVKVDVEGFEVPVLRDILELSVDFGNRLTIISEMRYSEESAAVFAAFRAAGFRALAITNAYSMLDYAGKHVHREPRAITALPQDQTDVAFVRA